MTNLAYTYEPEEMEVHSEKKAKAQKPKRKKKSILGRMYGLTLLFVLVSLSLVAIDEMQSLSTMQDNIKKIQMENSRLEKQVREAQAKLERIKNGKRIEEEAMAKLGMVYPTEQNKVYINSKENTVARKKVNEEKVFGILTTLFGGK